MGTYATKYPNQQKYKLTLKGRYQAHKYDAKKRGIEFSLTFEEWLDIWERSGHLNERGNKLGQYVMARPGDKGPYAVGNVDIVSVSQNHSDYAIRLRKEHVGPSQTYRRARRAQAGLLGLITRREHA